MLKAKTLFRFPSVPRHASSAIAARRDKDAGLVTEMAGDGVRLASLPQCGIDSGLATLVFLVGGGARMEVKSSDRGLSHLIRRSLGQSTNQFTGINLTRHFEQMGARLRVSGTREHLIYSIDVAPNLAPRAGALLANMLSETVFYEWELRDNVYPLMKHDTNILHRHDLEGLCSEMLHEAAFGQHPDGSLLGRSLYCSLDMIGTHSIDQINEYMANTLIPENCVLGLVNADSNPIDTLRQIKNELSLRPGHAQEKREPSHVFTGTELRYDNIAAPGTYVMFAKYVPGGRTDVNMHMAMAVANRALNGAVNRVSWADGSSGTTQLAKTAGAGGFESDVTQCTSFYTAFKEHGLFGVCVLGSCGRATGARVEAAYATLSKLASTGLSSEEVTRGKELLKADLSYKGENAGEYAAFMTLQLLENGKCYSSEELIESVNNLTPEAVNKAVKQVLSSKPAAMSVVGQHTSYTPPLSAIRGN